MFNKYLSFILKGFSLFIPLPLGLVSPLCLTPLPVLSTDQGTLWVVCKIALLIRFVYNFFSAFDSAALQKRSCRQDWEVLITMKLYVYVLNCLTVFGKTLKPIIQIMAFSLPWNNFSVKPWENFLINRFLIGGLTPCKSPLSRDNSSTGCSDLLDKSHINDMLIIKWTWPCRIS